jgi:4-hydroxy-4-methyl-2-oxoglutarate aldolase
MSGAQDQAVVRASRLDTATISDALDRLGIQGQCHRIAPRSPAFRLAGRVFTVLFRPAGMPPGTVGDFIDDVTPGSVIVLDNGGREDATVWGDILTEIAHRNGIAGTVIDGISRDVALALDLGYPIYSRGHWMRTGKDRVQVDAMQVSVNIGQARVAPGDLLRGDAEGVLVIPQEHELRVLDAAEEIAAVEEGIRNAVREGSSLRAARERFRYHQLQTREAHGAAAIPASRTF